MGNLCSICAGHSSNVPMTDSQRNAEICKCYLMINQKQYRGSERDLTVQQRSLLRRAKRVDIGYMGKWAFIMSK